ncbi:MAG: hypothetical protein ACJAU0_000066 [Flavobacteriales bacterium]|jgi:hypothetical protein
MLRRLILTPVIIALLFISCGPNKKEADISSLKKEVSILNLQDSLGQIDFSQPEREYQRLYQNFGEFWTNYTEDILQIGSGQEKATLQLMQEFLTYPDIELSNQAIQEELTSQLEGYSIALDMAFRRYRFFFPEDQLPDVVYMNSGHNFAVFPTQQHLGIGLEFFLGSDHVISQSLDPQLFPQYMRAKMEPRFLVPDALRGWLLVHYQDQYYHEESLISNLMYWGKMMYILELMLPERSKASLIDYTEEQLAWCTSSERNLWVELSQQDVLYETRRFEINRWIIDGPFTRVEGLPQETPPRIGVWIAWQIVNDYMERNPKTTLQELLESENYIALLNAYRPN